jgi:23S rRNA pseudouridine1911/1915/1917 synthase
MVPASNAGERLDRFLATAQTDLSRSRLQALIRAGLVQVNGLPARASLRLRDGDRVQVEVPEPRAAAPLCPEALPLTVVYEDEWLLVIDKPAGMVVHPGAGVASGTLAHALLHRHPEIAGVGGEDRPGIVHRLDKDTSGLMVVARHPRAYRGLVEAIARRQVRRVYRALAWGAPGADQGRIEGSIGRDPRNRKRMAVVGSGGRPAATRWRVVERFGGVATLLEAILETGRTHQIRVHLAAIGHPLLGDEAYGGGFKTKANHLAPDAREALEALGRQALHAYLLAIEHPSQGKNLEFRSELPDELLRLRHSLGGRGKSG